MKEITFHVTNIVSNYVDFDVTDEDYEKLQSGINPEYVIKDFEDKVKEALYGEDSFADIVENYEMV